MDRELKPSAEKVRRAVQQMGYDFTIIQFDASTRTAADAAAAIGCTVSQIAKSLIFRAVSANVPILIIASGPNRVDVKIIEEAVGDSIGKADADFVRETTGFSIGGVPPVGHLQPVRTFIDRDLLVHDVIWAAAGTPNAVFKLTPTDLQEMTGGIITAVH